MHIEMWRNYVRIIFYKNILRTNFCHLIINISTNTHVVIVFRNWRSGQRGQICQCKNTSFDISRQYEVARRILQKIGMGKEWNLLTCGWNGIFTRRKPKIRIIENVGKDYKLRMAKHNITQLIHNQEQCFLFSWSMGESTTRLYSCGDSASTMGMIVNGFNILAKTSRSTFCASIDPPKP